MKDSEEIIREAAKYSCEFSSLMVVLRELKAPSDVSLFVKDLMYVIFGRGYVKGVAEYIANSNDKWEINYSLHKHYIRKAKKLAKQLEKEYEEKYENLR